MATGIPIVYYEQRNRCKLTLCIYMLDITTLFNPPFHRDERVEHLAYLPTDLPTFFLLFFFSSFSVLRNPCKYLPTEYARQVYSLTYLPTKYSLKYPEYFEGN
jgi:hypothetical protein